MKENRLYRWFAEIGADPELAVRQAANLHRQVPLLYGLLLINSLGVSITHYGKAPDMLTVSMPAALFLATLFRIAHWLRAARRGMPTPQQAQRQLRATTVLAVVMGAAYVTWSLLLAPYGGSFEQAHVALYVSTTVIGCIFCLVALPQAALMVALAVLPAFIVACLSRNQLMFIAFGINVALVLVVLLRALFVSFENFRQQVHASAILGSQRDELHRLNEENRALALADSLTQLPNRRQFYADLDDMAERAADGVPFAVGLLDLDRFKPVNDTYGHHVGDHLLIELAQRLRRTADPLVGIYRLGGDEFGLLASGDVERFPAACERLWQHLAVPFRIGELTITIGGSIGVARSTEAGANPRELFDRADYALYHAKRVNGGGVCQFTPSLETAVRAERAIEAALQSSSFDDELQVVLQPIVHLRSGRLSTVEVLARWTSPLVGEVSPTDFIAIAERSTVIHSITRSVIRKGLAAAALLPANVSVAFNISAYDLTSEATLAAMRRAIGQAKIDPSRIWIEVTETALMRNAEAAAEALHAFRALGVKIALDDFGTGYSSLSHLHRLPIDKVKIDRSFIADLDQAQSRTIVQAVITLCRTLGVECVAEGVELEAQLSFLREIGCDYAQGYLFCRPIAAEDLAARMNETGGLLMPRQGGSRGLAA